MAVFLQLFYDITQSILIPIYNRAIIIENIPIKLFLYLAKCCIK